MILVRERCSVHGCDKRSKFGYLACRKHVKQRKREILSYGVSGVIAREMRRGMYP